MLRALQNVNNGHNWLYFYMRFAIMLAISVVIFIAQNRVFYDIESISDLLTALAIGSGVTLILIIPILIKTVRPYFAYVAVPGDWVIAGLFSYLIANDQLVILGMIGLLLVNGLMRFGTGLGLFQAVGVLLSVAVALYLNPSVGEYPLLNEPLQFVPGALLGISIALVSGFWSYWRDEHNSAINTRYKKRMAANNERLEYMRQRTHGIAELGARLNATFDYDKIVDAALDIGRLSLRSAKNERVVSMVLLVEDENTLRIETSRGVNYLDVNRTFKGEGGILSRALESGEPLIEPIGETDPELGAMVAFKNIRSTLVIPLRAGYDTYGAIVYGSTDADAFNTDTLDTLKAIAMQATVSLHNSVLYHTLRDEKERIMAIEESARQELVRDLHDVPTQTMSAIVMRLGSLKRVLEKYPDKAEGEVDTIYQMAQRATDEIRHVMFSLRPLSLETQGLVAALKQLVEKTEKTYGQKVVTQISPYAEMLLEKKQQGALFYLIEEAVNNARKYANAELIRVIVGLEENAVKLMVVDNGAGFDTERVGSNYENRGSFGMVNMRERAELVGGRFNLSSTPGVGTTITVHIPADTSSLPVLPEEPAEEKEQSPLMLRPRRRKKRQYTGPLSPDK